MFLNILIATDGSELAGRAQAQGMELARMLGARVTVLTVSRPFPMPGFGSMPAASLIEAHRKTTTESAARIPGAAKAAAKTAEVVCEALHATHEDAAEAIVGTAAEKGCDPLQHSGSGVPLSPHDIALPKRGAASRCGTD
jgi:nucleotide-binding universal stress UspA family protein